MSSNARPLSTRWRGAVRAGALAAGLIVAVGTPMAAHAQWERHDGWRREHHEWREHYHPYGGYVAPYYYGPSYGYVAPSYGYGYSYPGPSFSFSFRD